MDIRLQIFSKKSISRNTMHRKSLNIIQIVYLRTDNV